MIEARGLCKIFDEITAIDDLTLSISDGQVFGLLGTNGAGKSTLLRLAAGIYRPTAGQILVDGEKVFGNNDRKKDVFYLSDQQYHFTGSTPLEMGNFFAAQYPTFSLNEFRELLAAFHLEEKRRIATFSKGMTKQLDICCGIAANTRYLLCDETFDGLDPVVRHGVKSLLADRMAVKGLTPIIASHNLRELEDICDTVGLLHQGGLLLSKELSEIKNNVQKVQAVFPPDFNLGALQLPVVSCKQSGSLFTLVVRGEEEQVTACINRHQPLYMELVPLTLEEIFISETEVVGYDFTKLSL